MESDEELVKRTQCGSIAAFAQLIARYERSTLSMARSILGNLHAAEEVVQEAFVAAWTAIHELNSPGSFGQWLMLIAKRKAFRAMERERKQAGRSAAALTDVSANRQQSPQVDELLGQLEKLSEIERLFLTMHYFDGHSAKEISEMTGHPTGTVTKMMSRAYEKLRHMAWTTVEITK